MNCKGSLITLSSRGVFIDFDGERHHLPAHRRIISDVSGAGDTVVSVAALALASGVEPRNIAGLANLAGGLVCEELGIVPIDKSKLIEESSTRFPF